MSGGQNSPINQKIQYILIITELYVVTSKKLNWRFAVLHSPLSYTECTESKRWLSAVMPVNSQQTPSPTVSAISYRQWALKVKEHIWWSCGFWIQSPAAETFFSETAESQRYVDCRGDSWSTSSTASNMLPSCMAEPDIHLIRRDADYLYLVLTILR